jgi:hypothetical protein
MAKVKFNWSFRISNDQEDLEIWLNDGVNSLIEIKHETFMTHLANKLAEIIHHEHIHGTKTDISSMNAIYQAIEMRNEKGE